MTAWRRAGLGLAVAFAVAVGGVACSAPDTPSDSGDSAPPVTGTAAPVLPAAQVKPLVDGIVHRTVKPLGATRLAEGLVPPTNKWFSGLVFGDQPQPVFPLPLSFGLSGSGYGPRARRTSPPPRSAPPP